MKPTIKTGLIAAAAALLTNPAYGANLIGNGSFETPVITPGTYQLFSTGETFAGWSVVGAAGNVAIVSATFEQNGFTFPAASGSQFLDLTGISNSATGVQQNVATTAGTAYTLTFYVGNVVDPGGIFGVSSTVYVLVDGQQTFTATNSRGAGQTKQVWQKFTTTISATAASTTIAFINGDPPTDQNNGLDAISLVAQADDEPPAGTEPTSQD
jgi:hypothetical protein